MKTVIRILKRYRSEAILAPLMKLLEAGMELIVPLVVAAIIDVGIQSGDKGYIVRMCLVLAAFGAIGLAFSLTAQYFAAKAATMTVTTLRRNLFAHLQKLPYKTLDELGTSAMLTRMTADMNQVQSGINITLRLFLRSPLVVFGAMVMAFTIDVKSALIFLGVIPLVAVVVFGIMLVCRKYQKDVQTALDSVTRATRETLTGVRVLRAFSREEAEKKAFDEKNNDLTGLQLFVGRISSLTNPLTYVLINLAAVLLIYTGAIQVRAGTLQQGQVVALYNYISQILIELIKLADMILLIIKAVASSRRIEDVLVLPEGMETNGDPERKDEHAVCFDHVSLRYHEGSENALTDISFTAEPGETIGVIGGTGSGKSSLVNLIPRFYDATDGMVTVNGVDVRGRDTGTLRDKIGIVPQKATLFSGSIRDNLHWGNPNASDEEIDTALTLAQAMEFVSRYPDGIDHEIVEGGQNLSGGQKQRLTIARALVKSPKILILDDSASALDFATDAALRRSLRSLKDTTVFLVSQRVSTIAHADKIIVLDEGKVAGIGKHEELLKTCSVYREIYISQNREEETRK